jgi:hypothetical protein
LFTRPARRIQRSVSFSSPRCPDLVMP